MLSNIKHFIGIDPGVSGASALLIYNIETKQRIVLSVRDHNEAKLPIEYIAAETIRSFCEIADKKIGMCAIESVHAMPGQGVTSMFNFGKSFGAALASLEFARVKYKLVTPRKWMRELFSPHLPLKKRKEMSVSLANEKFEMVEPFLTLKKHHGRSDAMHLANYACDLWLAEKS